MPESLDAADHQVSRFGLMAAGVNSEEAWGLRRIIDKHLQFESLSMVQISRRVDAGDFFARDDIILPWTAKYRPEQSLGMKVYVQPEPTITL
jgi:hypothetical protein